MNLVNLFDLPNVPLAEELITVLLESPSVRVERIVSTGQTSDWYDQDENEFVALLQGEAELEYDDGGTIYMKAGDTLLIPPHRRHRVSYTSENPPCVWLCVFTK